MAEIFILKFIKTKNLKIQEMEKTNLFTILVVGLILVGISNGKL